LRLVVATAACDQLNVRPILGVPVRPGDRQLKVLESLSAWVTQAFFLR